LRGKRALQVGRDLDLRRQTEGRQRAGAKGLLGLRRFEAATRRRTRPSGILPGKRGGMSAGASSKQGGGGGGVAASSDDAHADLAHPAQARALAVSQGAWSGTMGACDSSGDERTAASQHFRRSRSKSKGGVVSSSVGQRGAIRKGGVANGVWPGVAPPRRAGGLRTAEENGGESDSDASIGYPEQGDDSDSDASIGYPVARTGRDEAKATGRNLRRKKGKVYILINAVTGKSRVGQTVGKLRCTSWMPFSAYVKWRTLDKGDEVVIVAGGCVQRRTRKIFRSISRKFARLRTKRGA